jgi:hypothetical protein
VSTLAKQCGIVRFCLVLIALVGLFAGLYHHHVNSFEHDSCLYCHAINHTAVPNITRLLCAPWFCPFSFLSHTLIERGSQILAILPTDPSGTSTPASGDLVLGELRRRRST